MGPVTGVYMPIPIPIPIPMPMPIGALVLKPTPSEGKRPRLACSTTDTPQGGTHQHAQTSITYQNGHTQARKKKAHKGEVVERGRQYIQLRCFGSQMHIPAWSGFLHNMNGPGTNQRSQKHTRGQGHKGARAQLASDWLWVSRPASTITTAQWRPPHPFRHCTAGCVPPSPLDRVCTPDRKDLSPLLLRSLPMAACPKSTLTEEPRDRPAKGKGKPRRGRGGGARWIRPPWKPTANRSNDHWHQRQERSARKWQPASLGARLWGVGRLALKSAVLCEEWRRVSAAVGGKVSGIYLRAGRQKSKVRHPSTQRIR
jgi:hypothetical protein